MASLLAGLGIKEKVKGIGDGKVTIDLNLGAANREIIDRAIDLRALEQDRSGHKDLMTLVPSIVHQRVSRSASNYRRLQAANHACEPTNAR